MRQKGIISQEGRNCKKCGEYKPYSYYYKQKYGTNGYSSRCKMCIADYQRGEYKERCYERSKKYVNSQDKGVYLIECKQGTYVGQSKHILSRIRDHRNPGNFITPVRTKKFKWKILELVEDTNERLVREQYWIDKLQPNLNKNNVSNDR